MKYIVILRRKIDRYVFENQRAKEKQRDRDHRPEADRSFPCKNAIQTVSRRASLCQE